MLSIYILKEYEGPGQKYREYKAPYQYSHCRALKTPMAGSPHRLIHIRYTAPATTGHRSLIIRIIAYHFGDHSLKLQGFKGMVALQGLSGLYSDRIYTVPYILHTFDRVLRSCGVIKIALAVSFSVPNS
jgi:hypothetical protein